MIVGDFELVEKIVEDASTETWLARSPRERVQVELLRADLVTNATARERFRREVVAIERMRGVPRFPRVVAQGLGADRPYYAIDHIDGETLESSIATRKPPPTFAQARKLLDEVLESLEALHARGIVHRDVKPRSVWITCATFFEEPPAFGTTRLRNFSLVKLEPRGEELQDITADGSVLGTPAYLAPERWDGVRAKAPSDLYGFGCVAFELFTGKPPFVGTRVVELIEKHLEEPAPPLPGELPRGLRELVARCLEKDPAKRPTASEARRLLSGIDPPPAPSPTEPFIGKLGRADSFLIDVKVDEGPYVVYRGRDTRNGFAPVLVKVPYAADRVMESRMRREVEALGRIRHPNVVALAGSGTWDGKPYVATRLLEGERPLQELARAGLSPRAARGLGVQLFAALEAVHAANLVHRDVSSTNARASEDPFAGPGETPHHLRLDGFELVRAPGETDDDLDDDRDITRTGQILGTPSSMSPEQCQGMPLGTATDVYSGGCVLHELFSGKPPFQGKSAFDLLRQHLLEPAPRLAGVPEELAALVASCLAKEPRSRPTAREVRERLSALELPFEEKRPLEDLNPFAAPTPVAAPAPPPPARPSPAKSGETIFTRLVFDDVPATNAPPQAAQLLAPELAPGDLLGTRWKVVEKLGTGGYGSVYLVQDTENLAVARAVKLPHAPDAKRHAQSELKYWGQLHIRAPDSVVHLLTIEESIARSVPVLAIFMEHMAGGSLASLARPKTQGELARLLRLFIQAARNLASIHRLRYLHRDVKPMNFLLDAERTRCKLSDFDTVVKLGKESEIRAKAVGTPPYMAPECWEERFSIASDVFALGATLFHLLSGRAPFGKEAPPARKSSSELAALLVDANPLVAPDLVQVALRCLEAKPEHRPPSVDDLVQDLVGLGLADDAANAAPASLAQLLAKQLGPEDVLHLAEQLRERGFRSVRSESTFDLIEEYCYTESPQEVLATNLTRRQLAQLAKALGIEGSQKADRDELIDRVLGALGFLPGPQVCPGIQSTRGFLERQLMELAHASTIEESVGLVQSALAALERIVELVVRFYGQLLHGSGTHAFLARKLGVKGERGLTFGQKVGALRALCLEKPEVPVAKRVEQVFRWPVFSDELVKKLGTIVQDRNRLAHGGDLGTLAAVQRFGRRVLAASIEVVTELAETDRTPRVVQIVSRQDDVYGRRFFVGRDDQGRSERIFTPQPLGVGQLYIFFPLTNPARINPLIFPYEARGTLDGR